MKIEVGSINENMDGGTTFCERRYTGMRATTKCKRTIRDQRHLQVEKVSVQSSSSPSKDRGGDLDFANKNTYPFRQVEGRHIES